MDSATALDIFTVFQQTSPTIHYYNSFHPANTNSPLHPLTPKARCFFKYYDSGKDCFMDRFFFSSSFLVFLAAKTLSTQFSCNRKSFGFVVV